MRTQRINTFGALQAVAPHWNPLLQASGSDSIFLTWEWISAWWDVFGSDFSLCVLTAHDDGTLVGVAPLMTGRLRTRTRATFRALMFIGQQGDTMAEDLDFFIRRGREAEVAAGFCDFIQQTLASEWDFVFLERILTSSPNLHAVTRMLSSLRFPTVLDNELPAPYVELRGNWPDFLAGKSRNFRNQWNNSWNRLSAEGEVKLLYGGSDLPLDTALAEVARLHRERWEGRSMSFRTQRYLRFHARVCERFHANGWLLLVFLTVGGKNIAVRYDYVYGNKLWCMQGGWSPEYADKRVGTLLTGKVIEWGLEHGLREYDFLGGEAPYKQRWASGSRVMVNLTAGNAASFRSRLWQWNRGLENVAREVRDHVRARAAQPARAVGHD